MRTMAAAKFKAQCLSIMDEVQAKREAVIITKHGKPIAQLVPTDDASDPLAVFHFPGIKITGDILSPANESDDWEVER